ncbi:hypothetical protein L1887_43983 [Cichorium endivia]|nr:hypothetical protein L1887_43983 [Cichorium endivia]
MAPSTSSTMSSRRCHRGRGTRAAHSATATTITEARCMHTDNHSPGLRPSSRESPILFAPLSPSQDPHMQVPRRISGGQHGNPSVMARPGQYRSRPGTPVSPLNMEGLSMEEVSMPSASGMAVPSLHGQGRSPAEARVRNDYFGPAGAGRLDTTEAQERRLGRQPSFRILCARTSE